MDQKIKSIVINSNNIPKSFQEIKQSTLCFHNINLLKKYAQNNRVKESFYFSKKYSKFSEYLIPKFNKSHSNTNIIKKPKCLFWKEVSIQKSAKHAPMKSILLKQMHQSLKNESTNLMTTFSIIKRNPESSSRSNNKHISSIRLNTPQIDKTKTITLTPIQKVIKTDYIRLKYLFRNETIKNVIKNSVINRDTPFNSASIIE